MTDLSTSVDSEWPCLQLLKAYGLPVAEARIATFGRQRVLVVERFDRCVTSNGQWLMRLLQEDFCQALGCSLWRSGTSGVGMLVRRSMSHAQTAVNSEGMAGRAAAVPARPQVW